MTSASLGYDSRISRLRLQHLSVTTPLRYDSRILGRGARRFLGARHRLRYFYDFIYRVLQNMLDKTLILWHNTRNDF
ncbi:MAG: hypothetical protein LBH75_02110 [Treponema sp.]|nr:hypothetical protein [Treponema sp.]